MRGAGTSSHTPLTPVKAVHFELAQYEIVELIGEGGFGVVYKARDRRLARFVAIKVLRGGVLDPRQLERFQREVQAMAQLDHGNIVPIYDVGDYVSQPYYVMKLVEGGNLSERFAEQRADRRAFIALMSKVARAVHYLHERQYVHRDLKPKNILIGDNGEPHVADFGLARLLSQDTDVTQTGELVGTLPYMAPEQLGARSGTVGPASDIWSLGIVLHEVLGGARPFSASDRSELRDRILTQEPPPLQLPDARPLEAVVARCLAKDPRDRYPSALELAEELERWLAGKPITTPPPARRRRPVRRLAGALTMSLFVALAAALLTLLPAPTGLDTLHADLRSGRPVALFDGRGRAPWWSWRLAEGGFTVPKGGARLGVQSFDRTILEVLPDPKLPSYRVMVRVRHDQGNRLSHAGLAFGIGRFQTDAGQATSFWTVVFNDLEAQLAPAPTNPVTLKYWIVRESADDGAVASRHLDLVARHRFEPSLAPLGTGPWRLLEVTVTPEIIQVRWDGNDAGQIRRADFAKMVAAWQAFEPDMGPIPGTFADVGSIGLFVDEGEAAFRGMVVEPLTPAPN